MSLIIAAPASGCGKTTITLGLLRAISRTQHIRPAKSGPDYIDPKFHEAACGQPCINLDAWAMPEAQIKSLAAGQTPLIIEGAMGLFDGAPPDGKGASADLARLLNLPVILVIDAGKMAGSVAPLVQGFARHDPKVQVAGVILNNVGSSRHEAMLRRALPDITIFGAIPRSSVLSRPSRHLGLLQAGEMPDLAAFIDQAADIMTQHLDLAAIRALLHPISGAAPAYPRKNRRIALAQDAAFAFTYAHDLARWQAEGATVLPFSPLANDPVPQADQIILPGGYPELYASQIAAADRFLRSLRNAAEQTPVYGECGGYMVLGESLIDADGKAHQMAGLLDLQTSFAQPKLHLGYRSLIGEADQYKGHEFHYASTIKASGTPLFHAYDAEGHDLGPMGLINGNVSGSFAHIIAPHPAISSSPGPMQSHD